MTAILGALAAPYYRQPVSISNKTISALSPGGTATAQYWLKPDGTITDGVSTLETWLIDGAAADYQVRATVTSGSVTGGSGTGTWLSCSTAREWEVENSAHNGSTVSATLTVEIRFASSGGLIDSATITLSATSDEA